MEYKKAPYAVSQGKSKQRFYPEKPHPYRGAFERDRDRIIHCQAFRRLEGKTQVFTPGLNDNYRNRLTHSLEVSQIGRTIARALNLNENLTEAVCLAHDLGHAPFGHTGERVLDDLMKDSGGFEHNDQTLRTVMLLEHPYPDFDGLNLMYETLLSLAKHRSRYDNPEFKREFSERNGPLEGQIADLADRIAYNCHDLEDGMRASLIDVEQLSEIKIFNQAREKVNARTIEDGSTRRTRTAKAIIEILVSDAIITSQKNIEAAGIKTLNDVYQTAGSLIGISTENEAKLNQLEDFLFNNFYMHETVREMTGKLEQWLGLLFNEICRDHSLMPKHFVKLAEKNGLERAVCDYIAGMTDRFCIKMVENLEIKSS